MEQLSGLDAAFVHQDSSRTPMHVCAVLIYDTSDGSLSLERLAPLVEERLQTHPLFQRQLKRVTLDMDTPYWIPAGPVDWHYHYKAHTLSPANPAQSFQSKLEQLHQGRMDLAKPLWQLHLLNGLNGLPGLPANCQALVLKAHHAAIDGVSLAEILQQLHRSPEGTPQGQAGEMPRPSQWDIWSRAGVNSMNRQIKFAETMSKLLPGLMRAQEARQEHTDLPATQRSRAHFNDQVSSRRSVGIVLIPMAEMVAIKRALRRVTYNDVASAIIAGALRNYLQKRKRLGEKSLVAGMPINLRAAAADDNKRSANQIATMSVGLATQIDDPVERVRTIHRYAVAGKKAIGALGTGTVMDISDSLPPPVLAEGIRTLARASRIPSAPVPFHTMISNVPGPGGDDHLDQARLVACAGLGPIRDNMGLFHIISTTTENCSISFNACKSLLPDSESYLEELRHSLAQLQQATVGH